MGVRVDEAVGVHKVFPPGSTCICIWLSEAVQFGLDGFSWYAFQLFRSRDPVSPTSTTGGYLYVGALQFWFLPLTN